jgi:hypothetical protein
MKNYLLLLAAAALVACGGGGAPSAPAAVALPVPAPAPTRTLVTLQSDAGDLIGQGKSYSYDMANADITVSATNNHLSVTVGGDQQWTADFQTGEGAQLAPGMYSDLDAYVPSAGSAKAGLRWYGEGRGCSTSKGWFAIDSVTYSGGTLQSLALRFERHCDGAAPALRGTVQFALGDKPAPSQPVSPIPSDLWHAPADFGIGAGNAVYLESSAGDYVGLGKTYRYDGRNSEVWAAEAGGHVGITVHADQQWSGNFKAMASQSRMQVGYYPNLRAFPFHNPVRGGFNWMGDGRGCSALAGWFAIDSVKYDNGVLTAIDMRFEQRCEERAATLHGAIHWIAPPAAVPVTITASAAGSWRPSAPVTAAGNYL